MLGSQAEYQGKEKQYLKTTKIKKTASEKSEADLWPDTVRATYEVLGHLFLYSLRNLILEPGEMTQ